MEMHVVCRTRALLPPRAYASHVRDCEREGGRTRVRPRKTSINGTPRSSIALRVEPLLPRLARPPDAVTLFHLLAVQTFNAVAAMPTRSLAA